MITRQDLVTFFHKFTSEPSLQLDNTGYSLTEVLGTHTLYLEEMFSVITHMHFFISLSALIFLMPPPFNRIHSYNPAFPPPPPKKLPKSHVSA